MTSRGKRQRHKYSPIHMVTASKDALAPYDIASAAAASAIDKENQPPNLPPSIHFSPSQLYDEHSTPPPPQPQPPPPPSPERTQLPSRALPSPSPPRKHASAFTPLTPFTPLSFRNVSERSSQPLQPFSTPQHSQPRTNTAFFRPITQPSPHSFAAATASPGPLPSAPLRSFDFTTPLRPSQSVKRPRSPPPSSYSTEKARFLRTLPQAHRYDAIVSTLEAEEQAVEQMATEWSESLAAPTTPPLSPSSRRFRRAGAEAEVPVTPPSVCSLSSSSASSVGSFSSPVSAALSAILERDSLKGRGGLEDDDILTPSPEGLLSGAEAAGGVPSLPASIFSSVFSQRLPLPPLTDEAKLLIKQSPMRLPPAPAATSAATKSAPLTHTVSFPALKPTAFTFAAPQLAASASAAGEWKGVMHIDEDRLYNATPTQSSASSSPISSSSYLSPSAFLSQASAASAASTAQQSSYLDSDAAMPQLESVPAEGGEEEAAEQPPSASQQSVATAAAASGNENELTPRVLSQEQDTEVARVTARSTETRRRSTRASARGEDSAAQQHASLTQTDETSSAGKRRRTSRSRLAVESPEQTSTAKPTSNGTHACDVAAPAAGDSVELSSVSKPKRRTSARRASASMSQPEPEETAPTQAAVEQPQTTRTRRSRAHTPSSDSPTSGALDSSDLSLTQSDAGLSQRSHRASRSAAGATWQCHWCTWQSPLQHMSCDMCSKSRGSRPDTVVEVEVTAGGGRARRGRKSTREATASQPDVASQAPAGVEEQGGSEPVSQQLLDTPASATPPSQPADTDFAACQPPPAFQPHSPALSPASLLADPADEGEATASAAQNEQRWTFTQPVLPAVRAGGRRRGRLELDGLQSQGAGFSATQASQLDSEQLHSATLHRRRRRRW